MLYELYISHSSLPPFVPVISQIYSRRWHKTFSSLSSVRQFCPVVTKTENLQCWSYKQPFSFRTDGLAVGVTRQTCSVRARVLTGCNETSYERCVVLYSFLQWIIIGRRGGDLATLATFTEMMQIVIWWQASFDEIPAPCLGYEITIWQMWENVI